MIKRSELNLNYDQIEKKMLKFIKESVENAGLSGAIVAVSGGIDSAVTLELTVRALGEENVKVIHLLERDVTFEQDSMDVMLHCARLNLTCEFFDITSILHVIQQSVPFIEYENKTPFGNLKSRLRMMLAYYFANSLSRMVIGTSNKSEYLTGFFTKFGDGGVDLMPLADLYKTQIRQFARYLDIPDNIIEKPPSPGFFRGQTDEEELGCDYETIDLIFLGWEKGYTNEEISQILHINLEIIESLEIRVKNNKHKRRLPLILRLGRETDT
jgi:NAD+ synthase